MRVVAPYRPYPYYYTLKQLMDISAHALLLDRAFLQPGPRRICLAQNRRLPYYDTSRLLIDDFTHALLLDRRFLVEFQGQGVFALFIIDDRRIHIRLGSKQRFSPTHSGRSQALLGEPG